MERVIYRKNLDVYKNGVQFVLQGFETADNLSRIIEITLMSGGDSIDLPEGIMAMMYTKTPLSLEPSIDECAIVGNKVVYELPQIPTEGITTMQLKLVESTTNGATSVLASPKFAIEIVKSNTDDSSIMQKNTFTAFENAVAKAKTVYDKRFLEMSIDEDCIFKAFYADGTIYETDILKRLFHVGSPVLSESFAKGGTGVRSGEDTDNAMYYSNVSKSEALSAKEAMNISKDMLEESKKHVVYTAFSVRFDTGELEYVSPAYDFSIGENGHLEVEGKAYSFEESIYHLISEWLDKNGVSLTHLENISQEHATQIANLLVRATKHEENISTLSPVKEKVEALEPKVKKAETDISDLQDQTWKTIHAQKYEGINTTSTGEKHSIVIDFGITNSQLFEYNEFRFILKEGSKCRLSGELGDYNGFVTFICRFSKGGNFIEKIREPIGSGFKTFGFDSTESDITLSQIKKECASYNNSDGLWLYYFNSESVGFPNIVLSGFFERQGQYIECTLDYSLDIEVQAKK